jgi:hypothetical protein
MKPEELKAKMKKTEAKEEQAENVQNNPHPIEQLVARVFAARNSAHREHVKTKSYAQHMALGSFYESIICKVDEIIETDQGMYGLIGDFSVEDVKPADFAKFVREEAIWFETNRDKFSKCEATLALVDELTAIYLQTAYKLTNLG